MKTYSEMLDQQQQGESIKPNPNNKITKKRLALGRSIMSIANGKSESAYNAAMDLLGNHIERLQEFVLSHSEEPAPELNKLVVQCYQLRQTDINDASDVLSFDNKEAKIFLDQQESDFYDEMGYVRDEFLGELVAAIDIAYAHIKSNPDGFIDAGLLQGVINTIGTKVNASTLKRAAQGKKPGILGLLSTGGKKHYAALVAYFNDPKNKDTRAKVVSGQIIDESELPNWNAPPVTSTTNPINQIGNDIAHDQIKKYLPYIIGGILLIVVIVYFAARRKK